MEEYARASVVLYPRMRSRFAGLADPLLRSSTSLEASGGGGGGSLAVDRRMEKGKAQLARSATSQVSHVLLPCPYAAYLIRLTTNVPLMGQQAIYYS